MRTGNRLMRRLEPARHRRNEFADVGRGRHLVSSRMGHQDIARNSFLQQKLSRLDNRLGVKAGTHRAVLERVGDRYQRHSLMVRHVGADDRHLAALRDARRGIVQRLIPAIPAAATRRGKP